MKRQTRSLKIIGCAFRVRDKLKCGFLEKGYENAERRIRPRATKKTAADILNGSSGNAGA
jgi:hypothetical protein